MRIEHEDFIIEADGTCITLSKKGVCGEKSATPGAEKEVVIGYFSTTEALCYRLIDVLAAEADVATIQELLSAIKQIHIDILGICSALGSTWKPLQKEVD